jgi:hypothetical protein
MGQGVLCVPSRLLLPSGKMSFPPPGRWAIPVAANRRAFDVACAVAIVFLLLQILVLGYGRDQAIFAVVGRTLLEGGMPYHDAWDIKPPGIYLLYALARWLFGGGEHAIRVVEIAFVLGGIGALTILGRRWWGSARLGLGAAVIWTLVYAQMDYWHTGQAESFAASLTVLMLAAAPLSASGWARWAWLRWVSAGLLAGCLVLLKPTFASTGLAMLGFLGLAPTLRSYPRLRASLLFVGGALFPCLLCLIWLAVRGALGDYLEISSSFLPRYAALSWRDLGVLTVAYRAFTEWWFGYSSLVFVGILLLLVLPPERDRRTPIWLLGAIALLYLAGVAFQAKFFPYQFSVVWPICALLAALGIHNLWLRIANRGLVAVVAFLLGLAVVTGMRSLSDDWGARFLSRMRLFSSDADVDLATTDRLRTFGTRDVADRRAVATLVAQHTPADSTILVWGFEPIFYTWANRQPASRFFFNIPLRAPWYRDSARSIFLHELQRKLPHAIVVVHGDLFQMVIGDADDSARSLARFGPLAELVASRYVRLTTIGDFDLYLLRVPVSLVAGPARGNPTP